MPSDGAQHEGTAAEVYEQHTVWCALLIDCGRVCVCVCRAMAEEQAHASPTAKAVKARAYREKRKVDLTSEEQAEARRKNRSMGTPPWLHAVLGWTAPLPLCPPCAGRLTTPA